LSQIESNRIKFKLNRIQIESNQVQIESELNPNCSNLIRSNLIRDSIKSNLNLTQFDLIRFVQNTSYDNGRSGCV